jgi:hypothetical protein
VVESLVLNLDNCFSDGHQFGMSGRTVLNENLFVSSQWKAHFICLKKLGAVKIVTILRKDCFGWDLGACAAGFFF